MVFSIKLISLFFFLLFNSCISIDLDSFKDHSAENIRFTPPSAPYKSASIKGMDASWHNPENNSSISFFSNCFKHSTQIPLSQFQQEILSGLKNFRIVKREKITYNNERTHHLWLRSLRQQPSASSQSMELLLFKKNNCFYVLISLTRESHPESEQEFKEFIQGFKIL